MKRLDRILVPVDLGPSTEGVAAAAARLASGFGANVRLLHAMEAIPHFPAGLELLDQTARERLAELYAGLVGRGVRCEPSMQIAGRPFDVIVRTADSADAHLIVIGRGGRHDGSHPGLGTTTSRVLRRSAKPALIVAPDTSGDIRRILCPVDGSSPSARGLRNAIMLARGLKAHLTVLTVIPEFALPLALDHRVHDLTATASDYEKMERGQFEQFVLGFDFGDVAWDKQVSRGHAADQIVHLATDGRYDLIVMGSTGRSGLPRLLLGSTAETVARRAPCAVLSVKRDDVLTADLEAEVADLNRLLAQGHELLQQGKYDEAIGRFDQCLLQDPYLATAVEGQATAHEQIGHHDLAVDLRKQAELIRRELWRQQAAKEGLLGY